MHPDGAALTIRADGSAAPSTLTARLVVDCMGHFSPIVRQVRRRTNHRPRFMAHTRLRPAA